MKNLTSNQLRDLRTKFRISKNHVNLPEVSLIADKDSTALFNVAWMQPLIPYLMGKDHPLWKRLFNIQKCIRTVDIDEVGDSSHLTFFEMMWNWSLWDYFKKEAVAWSWEFLTSYLEFDPRKLAVTVFAWDENAPRDEETASYRKETWLPENKISYLPADNNWRSPWPVWPCWPDTEIFYRVGESDFPPANSNVETDEDNRLEIRNNVFMEYYRDENWTLTKLTKQNVDTWMWFERMCSVLQGKSSVYETDLFFPMLEVISKYTWQSYTDNQHRFRIIADHARTAFMLVNDWLIPSNIWAGYVLRMIIRRMTYNLLLTGRKEGFFEKEENMTPFLSDLLNSISTLRNFNQPEILRVITSEIELFQKTIKNWMQILKKSLDIPPDKGDAEWNEAGGLLTASQVFALYDTYGFPLELTKEIAKESWFTIDETWFYAELEKAKEKSRASTSEKFKKWTDWSKYLEWIPQTEFIWYENLSLDQAKLLKEITLDDWQNVLIFDKTPFYPEMWGQMWDFWKITLDNWENKKITWVQKFAWVILHFID